MPWTKNLNFLRIGLGHLGMLGILALAWVLWLERSTSFDSSLYSYMLIWRESFYIPHDRMINYLWQWIPILGLKSGVSLPTFMKLMSLAPILFLYTCFIVIVHGFKNSVAGLYLVLCLLGLTRYKFYSAISEIYLSVGLIALLIAWLTIDRDRYHPMSQQKYTLVGALFIILCYLGHPLIFLPVGVLIGFDYLMKERWKSSAHFIWMALAGLLFLVRYMSSKGSFHEGHVMSGFMESIAGPDLLGRTANLYTMDIFWHYVETQWVFPIVVSFLLLLYLAVKKKYLAIVCLLFAEVLWVIFAVHVCAYLEKPFLFMIEGYFGFLALFFFLPLLYIEVDQGWRAYVRLGFGLGLIIFGLHRIYSVRTFYTERIESINQTIRYNEDLSSRNLVAPVDEETWDTYWFLWSVPFESLMHSSLSESGKSAVLLLSNKPKETLFRAPFEVMLGTDKDSIKNMNPNYFQMDERPFVKAKNPRTSTE